MQWDLAGADQEAISTALQLATGLELTVIGVLTKVWSMQTKIL